MPRKKGLMVRNFELMDETGALIFSAKNTPFRRVKRNLDQRLGEKGILDTERK